MLGEGASGGDHHGVGNPLGTNRSRGRTRGDDGESDGRKNVDVVALGNGDGAPFEMDGRKRRARGNNGAAICPEIQVGRIGFGVVGGIRQRKNDGTIDFAGHFPNDELGECGTHGGETDEDGGSNVVDDIGEADVCANGVRPRGKAAEVLRVDALLGS